MVDVHRIIHELSVAGMQPIRRTGNSTTSAVGAKLFKKPIKTNKDQIISKPRKKPFNTVNQSATPGWSSKSE